MPFARERILESAHDQRAHEAAVTEPHLGLGRVDVDVDLTRIKRDEQRQDRLAVARQIVRVGAAHRAKEELVAHRTAVDEEVLPERVGARERRQRRVALD